MEGLKALLNADPALLDRPFGPAGEPALLLASRLGQPAIVDFQLEQGADPNRRGGWGQMPLAAAADPV